MSFQSKLDTASNQRVDAVDKLNTYIERLPKEEQLALRELLTNFPVRIAHEALREEGYKIGRDTVTRWVKRYVVQG